METGKFHRDGTFFDMQARNQSVSPEFGIFFILANFANGAMMAVKCQDVTKDLRDANAKREFDWKA